MPFIPHTENEIQEMLHTIGVPSIPDLFAEIPKELQHSALPNVPPALNEMALNQLMRKRAEQDRGLHCYVGAGAYEHHIPAAVWEIASRGEWMTAYTPYQAEASQGTLQLLYEYQTMMASLMAMDISNASLYDGGSALAEAVLMAARSHSTAKKYRILMPKTVHPFYRQTVKTITRQQGVEIIEVLFDLKTGQIDLNELNKYKNQDDITAFVIPQPNFFGLLEEVDSLTDWAHAENIRVIGVVNPLAMALLKPPGQWGKKGADIACGEGQPLGVPLASGGPYYGFLCCKKEMVRQLPGRLVGRTIDAEGKPGFVLTLQAREQHIRRAKATSNICTNQGLLVTASTIYMSLMGPSGLRQVALACHHHLHILKNKLATLSEGEIVFQGPAFHETVVRFSLPVEAILKKLAKEKIQAGFSLQKYYPELGNSLLICVTETKTEEEIQAFANHIQSACSLFRE